MSETEHHQPSSCFVPGCTHANDSRGRSNLCGHHFSELLKRVNEKKSENPDWHRGKGGQRIIETLSRYSILKLLEISEATIRQAVANARLPLDFEEKLIGTFPHDPGLVRYMKYKAMPDKTFNGTIRSHAVLSSQFFTVFNEDEDTLALYRFTTKGKHLAGDLEKMAMKNARAFREILAARMPLPFDEAWQCVDFELDFYHYDRPPI